MNNNDNIETRFNNELDDLMKIADQQIKTKYYKQYYIDNKDKIRKQQKEYYQKKKLQKDIDKRFEKELHDLLNYGE